MVEAHCSSEEEVIEEDGVGFRRYSRSTPRFTARVMAELPELRMVHRYGTGYNTVDIEAGRGRGVWVANVPD